MAARVIPQVAPLIGAKITRVSLEIQVGNYSPAAQDYKFDELGRQCGVTFPDMYRIDDDGYSGADFNRPSIKLAKKWVREGKINCVGWAHVDRFARNMELGLRLIREFRELGAEVMLGNLGLYRDETTFKAQMHMWLMVSEMQKDTIREKSIEGALAKVRAGRPQGGRVRLGYRYVTAAELIFEAMKQNRVLTGKPENAFVRDEDGIKTWFLIEELIMAGASARKVCRELQARGIPSPSQRLGFTKRVRKNWSPSTLKKTMADPMYSTGFWYYNKTENVAVPEAKWRNKTGERHKMKTSQKARPQSQWVRLPLPGGAIVTPARQKAILEALERNGRTSVGKPAKPAAEGGIKAQLANITKCKCGYAVVPKHRNMPTGRRTWYGCSHRDVVTGVDLCDYFHVRQRGPKSHANSSDTSVLAGSMKRRNLPAEIFEPAVWEGMRSALVEKLDDLVSQYRAAIVADIDGDELKRMEAREPKVLKDLAAYAEKEVETEDDTLRKVYANRVSELSAELKLLRRRIASFTQESDSIQVDTARIKREVSAAMKATRPEHRRELFLVWIHEVVLDMREREIEITFRVPLRQKGANCQSQERDVDNYIYLKTKVRAA